MNAQTKEILQAIRDNYEAAIFSDNEDEAGRMECVVDDVLLAFGTEKEKDAACGVLGVCTICHRAQDDDGACNCTNKN